MRLHYVLIGYILPCASSIYSSVPLYVYLDSKFYSIFKGSDKIVIVGHNHSN